jgi:hypothetical protein
VSAPDNTAVNAAARALNLPASGDVKGQATYIRAMSDLLGNLPDTPFHNATHARFQEILHGGGGSLFSEYVKNNTYL